MKNISKTGLCVMCSLAFCFMAGCLGGDKPVKEVYLGYEGKQVKRIFIKRELLKDIDADSVKNFLYIRLAKEEAPPILGEITITSEQVIFEPLIAFTPGLRYELYLGNKKHSDIEIPPGDAADMPVVMRVYPHLDSLPENLLKVYIEFNYPMQEGVSADHIFLVKENDTLKNVFLDLQPELWNHDRTMLTLWLDPGRIKRDLQPNQQLGAPLAAGVHYKVVIKPGWQDGNGAAMEKAFEKKFYTIRRDSISPDPGLWEIVAPRAGAQLPLMIDFHESLDYQLLLSSLRIVDSKDREIKGEVLVSWDGSKWLFKPAEAWFPGDYFIEIESKLEDLAGNNLNRLFDTDLAKPQKKDQPEIYRLNFNIK